MLSRITYHKTAGLTSLPKKMTYLPEKYPRPLAFFPIRRYHTLDNRTQGSLDGQAERKRTASTLTPDADNAAVGSRTEIFYRRHSIRVSPVFRFGRASALRRQTGGTTLCRLTKNNAETPERRHKHDSIIHRPRRPRRRRRYSCPSKGDGHEGKLWTREGRHRSRRHRIDRGRHTQRSLKGEPSEKERNERT